MKMETDLDLNGHTLVKPKIGGNLDLGGHSLLNPKMGGDLEFTL